MPRQFQYLDLPGHSLNIDVFYDLVLLQNLDGDLFSCQIVSSELYFTKCAFSNCFADQVVPDAFGFVLTKFLSTFVFGLSMVTILGGRLGS